MKVLSMILVCCFFAFGCVEEDDDLDGAEGAAVWEINDFKCSWVYDYFADRIRKSGCSDEDLLEFREEYFDRFGLQMCTAGICAANAYSDVLGALSEATKEEFCEAAYWTVKSIQWCAEDEGIEIGF